MTASTCASVYGSGPQVAFTTSTRTCVGVAATPLAARATATTSSALAAVTVANQQRLPCIYRLRLSSTGKPTGLHIDFLNTAASGIDLAARENLAELVAARAPKERDRRVAGWILHPRV